MTFSQLEKTHRRGPRRGFTLIELMVVVVIIGILATIALPQIAGRLRERRVNQAAQQVALLYRNARLRAMGRGFSVLVRYDATTSDFTVLETLPTGGTMNCVPLIPPTCTSVNWAVAGNSRQVEHFNPTGAATGVVVAVTERPSNTTANLLDMCFSPHGRTYTRLVAANALAPMTGTVNVSVSRGTGTLQRQVNVLPNGMARLAL